MLRANQPIIAYFEAIKSLRIRQLALLLKAGYDPNLMLNARGQNGLQFMVNYFGATEAHFRLQVPLNRSTYLSMAKLMLDSGLDANAMDLLTDETVIFDAIRFDDKEMVGLLLNYIDLSLRNKTGETALMCAARFGSKQVVRMLLEHLRHLEMDGYFLRQRNRFGLTALELARGENLEAAKVLTKHLIAFGYHTGAILARSASHHQLVSDHHHRAAAAVPAAPAAAAAAAAVARRRNVAVSAAPYLLDPDCYSLASDLSDAELYGPPPAPSTSVKPARGAAAAATAAALAGAYYDPKAAEFNAYLLERRQQLHQPRTSAGSGVGLSRRASGHHQYAGSAAQMTGGGGGGGASDEDYDDDAYGVRASNANEAAAAVEAGGEAPAPGQLMRSRSCLLGPASAAGKQTGGGGGGGATGGVASSGKRSNARGGGGGGGM